MIDLVQEVTGRLIFAYIINGCRRVTQLEQGFKDLLLVENMTYLFIRMMARIVLSPPQALVDEVVRVVVRGLNPRQRVTVSTLLEERRKAYTSSGLFTADSKGNVDLSKMPSQGGTYTGKICKYL